MKTEQRDREYLFEQGAAEDERLRAQSGMIDQLTGELLDAAELRPGWRVLDLGSGTGSVSLLAAERVGPDGFVLGIDRDAETVDRARRDMAERGVSNVDFQVGDVQTLDGVEGGFDAVVGRLVYMYVPDPVEALRQAYARVRPGGLVCLQEADFTGSWAAPMTPLWQQIHGWLQETMAKAGADACMGHKLFASFRAAGLPDPELDVRIWIRSCADFPAYNWADVVNATLPLMEKLGVATREQLGPDTLSERLKADLVAHDGIMMVGPLFGAWSR